jgi:hypothetical protein
MPDDGLRARIERLEEDVREQRDRSDAQSRDHGEEHRRLWQELTGLAGAVIRVETRQAEQFRELSSDVGEVKTAVETLGRWSHKAREDDKKWLEGKVGEVRGEQTEERRLTGAQRVAVISAIALVVASVITAMATLAASGAFG